MLQETAEFKWTPQREQAAVHVAQDELTDEEIAGKLNITRMTLARWKTEPVFLARVDEHIAAYRAAIRRRGIAVVENRIGQLQERWRLMRQVIAERAEAPEMQGVAGGTTGLLVRTVKGIGKGDDFQLIELYAVDTGLLKELREHERQAAQELGQWAEKHELSGPNGGPLAVIGYEIQPPNGDRSSNSEPAPED